MFVVCAHYTVESELEVKFGESVIRSFWAAENSAQLHCGWRSPLLSSLGM